MAYDNTNSGALFKNAEKQDDRSPDYKGTINVNGVDHWLNGWRKTSKAGQQYLSLSIKPKQEGMTRSNRAEVVKAVRSAANRF